MEVGMILLAILNLCGIVSGTVVSIYGIVFACFVILAAVLRKRG